MSAQETLLHPREQNLFFGHQHAQNALREALDTDRLHHAWLLCGPRGVGKGTLAWCLGRFLLSEQRRPSSDFLKSPTDPLSAKQIASGSHPNLIELAPRWDDKKKDFKNIISVEEVREVKNFFSLQAARGGWRVCIVDAVENMTPNATNALLKLLEEPPPRSLFLLICHRPGLLLDTIRSRCRVLQMGLLAKSEISQILQAHIPDLSEQERERIAALCRGNPADALSMALNRDLELHEEIRGLLKNFSPDKAQEIATRLGQKQQAYTLFTRFISEWIAQQARHATPQHLTYWLRLWKEVQTIFQDVHTLNLNRKNAALYVFFLLSHLRLS